MCDITISADIQLYLNMGWERLVSIFDRNRRSKKKCNDTYINHHALDRLGKWRIYIIDELFNYYNVYKDTLYKAYGSTNIVSDYDITLIGVNAPEIMKNMFMQFLNTYKNTLFHSLDANIYSATVYSSTNINKSNRIYKINKELAVIVPLYADQTLLYSFSLIKLLEINIHKMIPDKYNLKHMLVRASRLQIGLNTILNNECKKIQRENKTYPANKVHIIAKYNLQYKYAVKLYNILYNNGNMHNLIYYACITTYFSVEAYYTPSTLNVVVQEIQAKHDIPLKYYDYICAAIENLGDMINHMLHDYEKQKISNKYLVLKYSKYIYRIYYSLGKALNDTALEKKAKKIRENIIPYRGTTIDNIDYSLVDYNNDILPAYLDKFVKTIILYIETSVNRYSVVLK